MSHFDPRTNQCELEVQRIIHLQNLANQLPYAFIDTKKVIKSYIPAVNASARIDVKSHILAVNASARIDVPEGQLANEYKICLKRGRLIGSNDITPRNRRTRRRIETPKEVHDKQKAPTEAYSKQKAPKNVYGK